MGNLRGSLRFPPLVRVTAIGMLHAFYVGPRVREHHLGVLDGLLLRTGSHHGRRRFPRLDSEPAIVGLLDVNVL